MAPENNTENNVGRDKIERQVNMGDDSTYIENQHIHNVKDKIPRFLTQKPFKTDFFIGRDNDLAAIENDYLQQNHLLVLVNGEGGMGKTTLAAQYWFKHENRYKHLAWIFADSGVGNALLSLAANLGVQFSPQDDEKTQIERIAEEINKLENPCLLVFDNANNDEDLKKYFVLLKKLSNCHILLTSRVAKLANTPVHPVKKLDDKYAVAIFKEYYPKLSDTESELLHNLLVSVGHNTLVIELLAKNLAIFNYFEATYSLTSLVKDLQNKGLFGIQNEKVEVVYQSDTLRTETPERIIEAMYDLSALSDLEKYLLNNFAVLPAENIPFTTLKDLLKPDDLHSFKASLRTLQQKSWIDFYENTNEFKISPVIQHNTKRKNAATLLNDCDTLIYTLIHELHPDKIHEDNYKMSTIFVLYAETVVVAFDEPNFNAVLLSQRIGNYYETIGNLDRAIYFYEKSNVISKKLCVIQPDNEYNKNGLAISYQYLGITHSALGNLDKALTFYEEYNRLAAALNEAFPTNVSFKNGLAISYQYLGITHSALGNLDKALAFFEERNRLGKELYKAYPTNVELKNGLAISYEKLGETHSALGNLDTALTFFEERNRLGKELYEAFSTNVELKNGLAISYEKLGQMHSILGNLDKALGFYEEQNRLGKELYEAYPTNVSFKNGLAVSYAKLGITHSALGNLDKALVFFDECNRLSVALYAAFPTNVELKIDLAISNQFLGITHTSLGNLDKALVFFDEYNRLSVALYAAFLTNVELKNGLAISNQFLGNTHSALGNLDKALAFYEEYNRLEAALNEAYPTNVDFKNNLAISYSKLGETHSTLGNLDKALTFYEEYNRLEEELYEAYPTNVSFKNGLAISYSQLGCFFRDKKNDKKKARIYFEQCQTLWLELAASFPSYVEFQNNLKWVQGALKSLD
jgi:tetratricopeptide (TPR) repeat protein